jgi:hypothetical protein
MIFSCRTPNPPLAGGGFFFSRAAAVQPEFWESPFLIYINFSIN